MTFGSLLSLEGALATWMTASELPLRGGDWHATETRGGGCAMPSLRPGHDARDFQGSTSGVSWPMGGPPCSVGRKCSASCWKARVPRESRACSEHPADCLCRTIFGNSGLGVYVNQQITDWRSNLVKTWSREQSGPDIGSTKLIYSPRGKRGVALKPVGLILP